MSLRQAWFTKLVAGQPEVHSKTLPQKKKKKKIDNKLVVLGYLLSSILALLLVM
jgi:hypothetical protein